MLLHHGCVRRYRGIRKRWMVWRVSLHVLGWVREKGKGLRAVFRLPCIEPTARNDPHPRNLGGRRSPDQKGASSLAALGLSGVSSAAGAAGAALSSAAAWRTAALSPALANLLYLPSRGTSWP